MAGSADMSTDRVADDRDISDKPDPGTDPDAGKPESPTSLTPGAWKIGLTRAAGEFSKDQCTDLAAGIPRGIPGAQQRCGDGARGKAAACGQLTRHQQPG